MAWDSGWTRTAKVEAALKETELSIGSVIFHANRGRKSLQRDFVMYCTEDFIM